MRGGGRLIEKPSRESLPGCHEEVFLGVLASIKRVAHTGVRAPPHLPAPGDSIPHHTRPCPCSRCRELYPWIGRGFTNPSSKSIVVLLLFLFSGLFPFFRCVGVSCALDHQRIHTIKEYSLIVRTVKEYSLMVGGKRR